MLASGFVDAVIGHPTRICRYALTGVALAAYLFVHTRRRRTRLKSSKIRCSRSLAKNLKFGHPWAPPLRIKRTATRIASVSPLDVERFPLSKDRDRIHELGSRKRYDDG